MSKAGDSDRVVGHKDVINAAKELPWVELDSALHQHNEAAGQRRLRGTLNRPRGFSTGRITLPTWIHHSSSTGQNISNGIKRLIKYPEALAHRLQHTAFHLCYSNLTPFIFINTRRNLEWVLNYKAWKRKGNMELTGVAIPQFSIFHFPFSIFHLPSFPAFLHRNQHSTD